MGSSEKERRKKSQLVLRIVMTTVHTLSCHVDTSWQTEIDLYLLDLFNFMRQNLTSNITFHSFAVRHISRPSQDTAANPILEEHQNVRDSGGCSGGGDLSDRSDGVRRSRVENLRPLDTPAPRAYSPNL